MTVFYRLASNCKLQPRSKMSLLLLTRHTILHHFGGIHWHKGHIRRRSYLWDNVTPALAIKCSLARQVLSSACVQRGMKPLEAPKKGACLASDIPGLSTHPCLIQCTHTRYRYQDFTHWRIHRVVSSGLDSQNTQNVLIIEKITGGIMLNSI